MTLDNSKNKDIQFYSDWNIDRIKLRVEKQVNVSSSWQVIDTLDYNWYPLKFSACYLLNNKWHIAGSYGNQTIRFRTTASNIQVWGGTPGTYTIRYYIIRNSIATP